MTMGVPGILRAMRQEPMRKAVNDVMEICSHARAQAILHGVTMAVVFHPRSGQVTLETANPTDNSTSAGVPTGAGKPSVSGASSLNSAQFADSITLDTKSLSILMFFSIVARMSME